MGQVVLLQSPQTLYDFCPDLAALTQLTALGMRGPSVSNKALSAIRQSSTLPSHTVRICEHDWRKCIEA